MKNYFHSDFHFSGVTSVKSITFEAYQINSQAQILRTCNQRGFYKICLITGDNIVQYANKKIETRGTILFVGNLCTTYNWEFISDQQNGYACIFTKDFLKMFDYLNVVQQSRLFGTSDIPFFSLNNEQKNFITTVFQKIITEQSTNYSFKDELIHDWLSIIMHEALKLKMSTHFIEGSKSF
jgi:AraC family transcriptional activator of pobA